MMVRDKHLTILQTLFAFHGRIGRLRFFGFNCLIGILFIPVFVLMFEVTREISATADTYRGIAAMLSLPWLVCLWAGAALLVKRLHDLDRSGLHCLWICALWYVPSSMLPSAVSLALQLVAATASLALLLMRGTQGPNRFGREAGMTLERPIGNATHAA